MGQLWYMRTHIHATHLCYAMGLSGGRLCFQANGLFHTSPGQRPTAVEFA
jgi:hypothetical protein